MPRLFANMLAASLVTALSGIVSAATTVSFPTTNDFFTTPWAFGAPYIRGITDNPVRPSLGVSTPNPFLFGNPDTNSAEETTYFQFAFDAGLLDGPAQKAVVRVTAVPRQNSEPAVTPSTPILISAHRVTGDPIALIDPALASGPGSYVDFKNSHITAVEDTVSIGGAGVFEWDVTGLVNEWIASGETLFDYTVAMTARVGNAADTDSTGLFHAFVNKEANVAQAATLIVTVPEPVSLSAIAVGLFAFGRRERMSR